MLSTSPPEDAAVTRWLRTPHPMWSEGAAFSTVEESIRTIVLADELDAVIFVRESTPSRANPTGPGSPEALANKQPERRATEQR